MKRINMKMIVGIFAAALVSLAAEGAYDDHERRIGELEAKVAELQKQIAQLKNAPGAKKSDVWRNGSFNYLAIGNSLTQHGICKYWWNKIGMAASDADHDYFHLVIRGLERRFGKVTAHAINFSVWEINAHDRDQTFSRIDKLLDDRISLVTIQLGENVKDFKTFKEDYVSLIEHVRQKTGGKAQIIVIGDFWKDDPTRAEAAKKCGVDFVSLDEARNDPDRYRSSIGAVVYDAEGKPHTVRHSGVAKHPGDAGMAFIADKVLEKVK